MGTRKSINIRQQEDYKEEPCRKYFTRNDLPVRIVIHNNQWERVIIFLKKEGYTLDKAPEQLEKLTRNGDRCESIFVDKTGYVTYCTKKCEADDKGEGKCICNAAGHKIVSI